MMPQDKRRLLASSRVAVALLACVIPAQSAWAQANQTGGWTTLSYGMDQINPIHLQLLHNGKVLIVAGSENVADENSVSKIHKAAVWDMTNGNVESGQIRILPNLPWDVFCSGQAAFPDGRVLVVGGTRQYDPFYGDPRTGVFDPATEKFIELQSMAHGRWYATILALATPAGSVTAPDNYHLLAFSGLNETGGTNNAVEMYKVGVGWSQEFPAPWTPPLYPWLHLLPNGKIFYSGYSPWSQVFDPVTRTWTGLVAPTKYGQDRNFGTSVLLPLLPSDNYRPRVMILGGHNPATNTTEIIDLSAATAQWVSSTPMSKPRIQMDAVLLPDGKLLAEGGSLNNEDTTTASKDADLFDTATGTRASAGMAAYARLYHSVALLLPDARVVVAGGNPQRGTYEHAIEVFTPPYLFTTDNNGLPVTGVPRPSITGAPTNIGYTQPFTVNTPDAAKIQSVVLMRPGSSTHAFDMEQRLVGLNFTAGAGTLNITAPPSSNIAPPGYYMLFILGTTDPKDPLKKVPSIARFVRLSFNSSNLPPKGAIKPAGPITVQAQTPVTFTGSGSDTSPGTVARYSWVFPQGNDSERPVTSNAQNPPPVSFPAPGTYVASLTTVDNQDESDPSPPTCTITVTAQAQLTVTITQPAPNTKVRGKNVNVAANVNGATGTSNAFALKITSATSGSQVFSQTQTTSGRNVRFKWDTTRSSNGAYTITVSVQDSAGRTAMASENVTVTN
jgi:Domain of unknown function (DUF1929)/PKD domain